MSAPSAKPRPGGQGLAVYPAERFRVTNGVNLGDPIGPAIDLALDDIYHLAPDSAPGRLALSMEGGPGALTVSEASDLGTPGAPVHLDCAVTLMATPLGTTVEAVVLVSTEPGSALIDAVWLLPLAPLLPRTEYALVAVDPAAAEDRFAELACVSFARGTRITMASGAQQEIETLAPGDRVLTRNNGVQEIRWIGQRTVRAQGALAPIVIAPGALNNAGELVVSPNHRLFIYQRRDRLGTGRREVLVRADRLVNGVTVTRGTGGFVDYFQLMFDTHEIVYAEGIATESLPLDTTTRPAVPKELRARLAGSRRASRPRAVEISEGAVDAALLRAASAS